MSFYSRQEFWGWVTWNSGNMASEQLPFSSEHQQTNIHILNNSIQADIYTRSIVFQLHALDAIDLYISLNCTFNSTISYITNLPWR